MLLHILYYSLYAFALLLLLYFRNHLKGALAIFALILIAGACNQILMEVLKYNGKSYSWLINLFSALECLGWCFYYVSAIQTERYKRPATYGYIVFLTLSLLLYAAGIDFIQTESFIIFSVESLIIVGLSLLFLWELYLTSTENNLYGLSYFWIAIGNIFFYGSCWLVMAMHHITHSAFPKLASDLLNITRFANIITIILFIIALLCLRKRK